MDIFCVKNMHFFFLSPVPWSQACVYIHTHATWLIDIAGDLRKMQYDSVSAMEANLLFVSRCIFPVCFDAITSEQSGICLLKSIAVGGENIFSGLASYKVLF